MSEEKNELSNTVHLPKTEFPMRAGLAKSEPLRVAKWEQEKVYQQLRVQREQSPRWVLHDGPPFANGNIHMGHALNKLTKDFCVRYHSMKGEDAPFVPGWDCHGMPIEHKVVKELENGNEASKDPVRIRELCKKEAAKYIDLQREQFKRLGIWADWENPYITMSAEFESAQLDAYWSLLDAGQIYQGSKPVHWSWGCRTALAEAELEYKDVESPSIYVKFALEKESADRIVETDLPVYAVIWTTTPWTLPANVAIALNEAFEYGAYQIEDEIWILATGLANVLFEKIEKNPKLVWQGKGGLFDKMTARHPFIEDRQVLLCLANYVTLEAGTGLVHTAPGHGQEDYVTGVRYELPVLCPVDEDGRYTDEFALMKGRQVSDPKTNQAVLELLLEKKALIYSEMFVHSYPHCWRSKTPVIFRATRQWFISLEENGLREKTMEQISRVHWRNRWGAERFSNMMKDRADWCISRQRYWGVPIYMFYDPDGKPFFNEDCYKKIKIMIETEGSDAWFAAGADASRFLPDRVPGDRSAYTKETDTLDVWFDSGSSHLAVLKKRPGLAYPADLYMEGSDQYRGWFQSSMLISVGVNGSAPYKSVLSTGWVLDQKGKAMHKSAGNVIDPLKVMEKYGADILRLWVASEDSTADLGIGDDILKSMADAYRRIRNTFRWLLGNLNEFDPSRLLKPEAMQPLDQWILSRLSSLVDDCRNSMENCEFHRFYSRYVNFCAVDLSSLAFDIHKDTFYTLARNDERRLSAETAMYHVLLVLVKLGAPVLTFTCEEVWDHMEASWKDADSVHFSKWPEIPADWKNQELENELDVFFSTIRPVVSKKLEDARVAREIGHPYDAQIALNVHSKKIYALLQKYESCLPSWFIVSQVDLQRSAPHDGLVLEADEVEVSATTAIKCARCWRRPGDVSENSGICSRCSEALKADGQSTDF